MGDTQSKAILKAPENRRGEAVRYAGGEKDASYGTLLNDTDAVWNCAMVTLDGGSYSKIWHIWAQPPGTSVGLEAGFQILLHSTDTDADFMDEKGNLWASMSYNQEADRTFSIAQGGYQ